MQAPDSAITFSNLVMNGGQIDNGDNGLVTIAGAINIASNTAIYSDPVYGPVVNFDVPGSYQPANNFVGQGAFSDPGNNYWNPVRNNNTTHPATNSDGVTVSAITLTSHEQFTYDGGGGVQGEPAGLEAAYEGVTSFGHGGQQLA